MSRSSFVPCGLKTCASISISALAAVVLVSIPGCSGGSGTPPVSPISVSVTASSTTVDGKDTVTLTATVANDSSNAGVTWSAPATGSLSSTTAASPTYMAPAATGSAQSVTITATSVTDKSKSSSVTLTIPVVPAITTSSLPAATAGAAYTTTLAGSGGVAPYTWKLLSGTLPTGVSLNPTTGVISAIAGATAATAATSLTFQLTDSGTPTALTATATLSLSISSPPSAPIAGSVIFGNSCGNLVGPSVELSINTNPVQTTATDGNGNFTFAAIPSGTYTITPLLAGTNAIFTPNTQSVTVNSGGALTSFKANVGYAVSGMVSYTGTATGPINLALQYNCPNGGEGEVLGTSIPAPGPFTINGVPPGSYVIYAWRDALSNGAPNMSDPTGNSTALAVSAANLTGVSVALTDPAPVTFNPATSTSPYLSAIPIDQGVVLNGGTLSEVFSSTPNFWRLMGVGFPELATSYTVQWSTDPSFNTITGSKSFPATGSGTWIVNGLTDGQILYFRYQGVAGSATSQFPGVFGPTTIGEPAGAVTVSGNVTFSSPATGPLYIYFNNQTTHQSYYTSVANPASPQPYSIQLPADGNYSFNAFIDQNNDNIEDNGDMISGGPAYIVAVTGSTATQDIKMFGGGNSFVAGGLTNNQLVDSSGNTSQYYDFDFDASNGSKKLTAIELVSGPNVIVPQDFPRTTLVSILSFLSGFSLYGNTPNIGDAYGLRLTYSDGSQETRTETVTGVPGSFGANPSPAGIGTNLTPNFSWTDPPSASDYTYTFFLPGGSAQWSIPAQGFGESFSSSIDSLTWGVDPTGGGNLPTSSSLVNGTQYQWNVTAEDSNGNSSSLNVGYDPGYSGLYLPAANPGTLGAATVGQSYTGTITASGGTSPTMTVTGLSDGLTSSSNGGTLTIGGTPIAAGTIAFQVTVQDSTGATWGPVTYTINVAN